MGYFKWKVDPILPFFIHSANSSSSPRRSTITLRYSSNIKGAKAFVGYYLKSNKTSVKFTNVELWLGSQCLSTHLVKCFCIQNFTEIIIFFPRLAFCIRSGMKKLYFFRSLNKYLWKLVSTVYIIYKVRVFF